MIFQPTPADPQTYAYVMDGGPLATQGAQRKWAEEAFLHFYAPASRQLALPPAAPSVFPVSENDVELESPRFVPSALNELAARGYQRKNSWR